MIDFNYNENTCSSAFSNQLNQLIDKSLQDNHNSKEGRSYLGASRLGVNCSRLLQYEFLKVPKDKGREFSGQTLRHFAAGHLFEELAIKYLRDAGITLLTENSDSKQFGFTALNGKMAGHVDGVIIAAPDSLGLKLPALWEMKSMNSRNWKSTVKNSLRISHPIYAAQIALYQAYMEEQFAGISDNPTVFTAINKDTSELYHELVPFDSSLAQKMSDKAVNIINACRAKELLPRIATSRDYFECKYCAYQDRCWSKLDDKGGRL